MTLLRRVLPPLFAGAIAILALLAPGALGAQGVGPVAVAASGPTGATGPTSPAPLLSATVTSCHPDALQANRYAIFASQMTSVPGTRTMAVNFALQERSAAAATFATVSAPGFGAWVASEPGVGIYTYDHEVTSLPAPAAFRVLVRARWIDRHRHVIRHQQLLSPVCAQPLETPNLAIGTLSRAPGGQAATVSYSVQVLNDGTAPAGPFQVSLSVNGVALSNVSVASLAAGAAQCVKRDCHHRGGGKGTRGEAIEPGREIHPARQTGGGLFPETARVGSGGHGWRLEGRTRLASPVWQGLEL